MSWLEGIVVCTDVVQQAAAPGTGERGLPDRLRNVPLPEFTREPDNFLGLLAGGLSMGQWLSLPMVALGAILFSLTAKRSSR